MTEEFSNIVYENPEVAALVRDLGLVLVDSPECREFFAARRASHYSRYLFCDRYKDWLKSKSFHRSIVCRQMYLAYRKGSRYVPSPDVKVSAQLKLF